MTVDELILAVRIALGQADVETCSAVDLDANHEVTIDEVVGAILQGLDGCVALPATPTASPTTSLTPFPTFTPTLCPDVKVPIVRPVTSPTSELTQTINVFLFLGRYRSASVCSEAGCNSVSLSDSPPASHDLMITVPLLANSTNHLRVCASASCGTACIEGPALEVIHADTEP